MPAIENNQQVIQQLESEEVHTSTEATELLRYLIANMPLRSEVATKDDLAKLGHELRDHTSKECAKVRGDFVSVAHQQDEKTNEVVRTTAKNGLFSRKDAERLIAINPFIQPVD